MAIHFLVCIFFKGILSFIFKLFGSRNNQISKLELLQCIPLVLQHASKYTYLVVDLHQYLPDVIKIVNEGELHNQIRAQKEILLIVYEFIRNVGDLHIDFNLILFYLNLLYFDSICISMKQNSWRSINEQQLLSSPKK